MVYDYSEQLNRIHLWAEACLEQSFLSNELFQQLELPVNQLNISSQDSDDLKPLFVAFLGGTGVGKSSLLNRLAGEAIARAGIERPTSREVTLFHHSSLKLNDLPAGVASTSVTLKLHHDDNNRQIIWLDMPDFDSIDSGNQQQVLEWLPYIDILIYVVSPERYRDRKSWELLLAEGGKHAWLFVMNHWDQALSEQYQDLQHQLTLAGFKDPMMFKTSCLINEGDDFADLVRHIQSLSGHLQRQLIIQHQEQRRYQALINWLELSREFILAAEISKWRASADEIWQQAAMSLQQGLEWSLLETSQMVAASTGPLKQLDIWDAWAQTRLEDGLDDIALSANEYRVPIKPIRHELQNIRIKASKLIHHECEVALRKSLSLPGNRLQRVLLFVTGVAEVLLPLLAMAVVSYQVFVGYYQSSIENKSYLGAEFAIHSSLLIGLTWLVPFFLHRKLQPSRETTALSGLKSGTEIALHLIGEEIAKICQVQSEQQEKHLQQLKAFKHECLPYTQTKFKDSQIMRMLN